MILTGQCKKDFEVWLIGWLKENIAIEGEIPLQADVDFFWVYPDAMQWGVLQQFADDKDITLDVKTGYDERTDEKDGFDYQAFNFLGWESSRNEAQENALKHFNTEYNLTKIEDKLQCTK